MSGLGKIRFLSYSYIKHAGFGVLAALFLLLLQLFPVVQAQYEPAPESFYLQQQSYVNELNFTETNSTVLKGDWLFYPNQFITQPNSVLPHSRVKLPASLKELNGSNQGYATFIAHFKIPKAFVGRRIAIHIPNQYGAYRVYLNGDFLVRTGEISTNPLQQQNENAPRIAYFVAEKPYFTLTIQTSNYTHLHGGLENPMRIGIAKVVNRQFQLMMMSIAMVCGAVIGVSLFTILFSLFRGSRERNSRSIFVFGLFILFLALHNLFSAPYAYTIFTEINGLWGIRLEFIFTHLAILFFLSYIHLLNQRYLHRRIYQIAMLLLALNLSVTVVTEPEVFERLALYCSAFTLLVLANFLYGFYQTLKRKEAYSKINLYAIIFLSLTSLNDFLLMMNMIESVNLSFISTSLYALVIMFQQSRNYAYQTYHTEQLNNNLIQLNLSLDHKVKQRTLELHELNEKLQYQIKIDALTGAYNRRALNAEIQRLFELTQQQPESGLIFAMLDVDYFKNYNDHYGHLKGDEILKNLVKVLSQALPDSAYLARYGGEEFAILLHNMAIPTAIAHLEHALQAVRDAEFEHINRLDAQHCVTLSIGVAWLNTTQNYADIHELMKAADVQLYAAKEAGRDQLQHISGEYSA